MNDRLASCCALLIAVWLVTVGRAAEKIAAPLPAPLAKLQSQLRTAPVRVRGTPEPPPPYRVERVWPDLPLKLPIALLHEPGTSSYFLIDQQKSYGTARLARLKAPYQTDSLETLVPFPEGTVAYSLVCHPEFLKNGYLYVGLNSGTEPAAKRSQVVRYTVERQAPYRLLPESALTILSWESNGHNGAAVAFGPDGMLYITSGDGTSDSDTNIVAQGLDHLLAKVLRIDVDHPAPGQAYSIPADNPFRERVGARPETWAFGLRNPWRMSIDPRQGHVWVGNNGQDLWEQIYRVQRGANYGWSVYEGNHLFYPQRTLGPVPVSPPQFEHPHSEARSLTGGVVYLGTDLPELTGAYLYGDYSTGKIWGAKLEGDRLVWHRELADSTLQITSFALDERQELLITDHGGERQGGVYRLVPQQGAWSPEDFPRTLSATGLFGSVPEHRVHPGLLPYSVKSPLWSDGAYKERYLHLPPAAPAVAHPPIDATTARGWNLPDESVVVKSFALPSAEPAGSRRWVETRLLVKQQGEWVGYSYEWNEAQTEATLVAAGGADRVFTVPGAGNSVQQQTWHYPSRTECMVCHTRAANYMLGLSTVQFDKPHDYDGTTLNQLEVLNQLQLAKVSAPAKSAAALVDPSDTAAPLEARVRSYLHANCAHCHVEAGGGNAQIDLEASTATDKMKLIQVRPLHARFGLDDAWLVTPGQPQQSILLHRMAKRGPGQMPPLASSQVDEQAVQLIQQWIESLSAAK